MSSEPDRATALIAKMLGLKLFIVFNKPKGGDIRPHLADHLDYMIALEKAGKLFASGPMGLPGSGYGMTILRVADEDEARAIASKDPFYLAGLREFTIDSWTVMEGALTVSLNFSDGTMRIG
jgi:uncharacterized protein YciI